MPKSSNVGLQVPEGCRRLVAGSHAGKGIAVFTSGGDSQGMNAADTMADIVSRPL